MQSAKQWLAWLIIYIAEAVVRAEAQHTGRGAENQAGWKQQTFWRSRNRFCAFLFFSCTAARRSSCGLPDAARLRLRCAAASSSAASAPAGAACDESC